MKNVRVISEIYLRRVLDPLESETGIFSYIRELNYNVCMHGNKFDKNLLIRIKMGYWALGFVSQIIDSGEGFDYNKIGKGFRNKGVGARKFMESKNHFVSWEGEGNVADEK